MQNAKDHHFVVLVVEDDPNDVTLVGVAARNCKAPIQFHFVKDGDETIAYMTGQNQFANRSKHPLPQLIVLDLQIPRRDGFQVLKWLRTQPHLRNLQVVVWTGWEHPDAQDRARQAGADLFLRKPDEAAGWTNFIGMITLALERRMPAELAHPPMPPTLQNFNANRRLLRG